LSPPRTPGERRALLFIVALVFLDTMSFGLVIPVLPGLVMELGRVSLSAATAIGGWLVMSFAIAQFLASPVLGGLSDRFGRRPILLLSMGGHALAFLIAAFAPSLLVLLGGRVVAGLTGASFSTAYAYIADVTPPQRRAQDFGLVGVAFGLGFMAGPALGGLLGGIDLRLPFLVAAGACGLNLLLGIFVLPESLAYAKRRPFSLRSANPFLVFGRLSALRGPLLVLASVHFLWWLAIQAQHSIWPYYTQFRYGWSPQEVGLSLGLVGGLAVLVNGMVVKRAVRFLGEGRTLQTGLLMGATAMLVYALSAQSLPVLAGIVVGAFGGLAPSSLQALATSQTAANRQGELQGLLNALSSLTIIIGPLFYSQLFARVTAAEGWAGAPFLVAALLALAAFLFVRRGIGDMRLSPATDRPATAPGDETLIPG
jgi:DHA1 family tetracycline resistance protein-like MFS transporter